MVKSLCVLALVGALCVGCRGEGEETAVHPSHPATASDPRCPFPTVRPTYLPWLAPDDPIPSPTRSYDRQIEQAQLSWTNPARPQDGVGLTLYPLSVGTTPEKRLGVDVQGSVGYLHHGPGETSAWWDLDAGCNFLELSVDLEDSSQRRLDQELLKIARALRPARG